MLDGLSDNASDATEFELVYLEGAHPAYPDDDEKTHLRVWGYGEPDDRISGLEKSIAHILNALDSDDKNTFIGILGFSSGAAMAAIIASLLEKRKAVFGRPLTVHKNFPKKCSTVN